MAEFIFRQLPVDAYGTVRGVAWQRFAPSLRGTHGLSIAAAAAVTTPWEGKPMHRTIRVTPPRGNRRLLWLALFAAGSAGAAGINPTLLDYRGAATQDVLLVMDDQSKPLTTPLASDTDYLLRRRILVANLIARADESQTDVRAWLDKRGIAYRPYWIANVIQAELPMQALDELARATAGSALGRIARVEPNPLLTSRLPKLEATDTAIEAVATGVTRIRAPSAWSAGFRGQGVVIGGMDTGYQSEPSGTAATVPRLERRYGEPQLPLARRGP